MAEPPQSYPVTFTAEEEQALDEEYHVQSFSIDLEEEEDLDWEESLPQSTARLPIDQVTASFIPLTALFSSLKTSLLA